MSFTIYSGNGDSLTVKPIRDACLPVKLKGIVAQIGTWRALTVKVGSGEICISNDGYGFMTAKDIVIVLVTSLNPILRGSGVRLLSSTQFPYAL